MIRVFDESKNTIRRRVNESPLQYTSTLSEYLRYIFIEDIDGLIYNKSCMRFYADKAC